MTVRTEKFTEEFEAGARHYSKTGGIQGFADDFAVMLGEIDALRKNKRTTRRDGTPIYYITRGEAGDCVVGMSLLIEKNLKQNTEAADRKVKRLIRFRDRLAQWRTGVKPRVPIVEDTFGFERGMRDA